MRHSAMSDNTPALWTDHLSNDLTVRGYEDGDVIVHLTSKRNESVLLDAAAIDPLVEHLSDDNPPAYQDIILMENDYETNRLRYFNEIVLIESGYGTMPLSHSLATELSESLAKNGRYGTHETGHLPEF